ncbi:Ig-like domain-containing protein [Paenibacillus contaminans]|nr:Ig-like domain-containing protein [Paenibacillus contaminans]
MSESSSNLSREYSQKHIRGGEKKVMKKTLSSVVSIALISSMFATAAFAAETTSTPETTNTSVSATKEMTTLEKYEALKAAGVFEGDSTGANLEGLTDRAQIAKIIAKAFELSENASGASVYNDEAFKTPEYSWSLGFVGAVTKAGLMDGVWEGVFDPTSNVTHEQIATILVKAFKLEHPATAEVEGEVSDWAKGYVAAAVKAGLIKAQADYTVAAKRSDLVESAWTAIEKIDSEKPVTALKVSGVTALTNSKVSITLSEAVTAVDKTKISIKNFDGSALEVKDASLSADGKTVTVTTATQTAYAAYSLTADGVTKNFVGLPVDTTKPSVVGTVSVDYKGVLTVAFNEKVDAATATNVANYTFDNNLKAKTATLDSATNKVTIVTEAQTSGQLYQLTVSNVTDLAGNTMDSKSGLYFSGVVDTNKPQISTVTVNTDGTVEVKFTEKVDATLATSVQNYVFDNSLTATSATINSDNDVVTLTTSAQTNGQLYKMTVKNVADISGNVIDAVDKFFSGIVDTTKPQIATFTANQDSSITVIFNEKVNKEQAENVANYVIDNNLTVTSASLNADDLKTVTLKTTVPVVGQLYKMTVKNVADKSGNVMDAADKFFSGMVDTAGPTIVSATTDPVTNNQVVIKFNEKLNKDLAQDPTNYSVDGDLKYPTKAVYDESTGVGIVTLTTASQTSGKLYTVTINNLKDLSGNVISANSKKGFSGVNTSTTTLNLQTIQAVDNNTLDVYFDATPSDADAQSVTLTVYDGSSASGTPKALVLVSQGKRPDNSKVVRFYYTSTDGVFTQGKAYTAVVSGAASLPSDVSKNTKTFGGTPVASARPKALTASPVNSTSAKIVFDKVVKGLHASRIHIVDAADSSYVIDVTGIQDADGSGNLDNVTTAILNFGDSKPLKGGRTYKVTFDAGITDPAGNQLQIGSDYVVTLGGIDLANAAPKMVSTAVIDKYNFDIIFSEPVLNAGAAGVQYIITDNTDSSVVAVTNAVYTASSDKTRLTVSLNKDAAPAGLVGGRAYTVTYVTATGSIIDKQGKAYDTTTDANKVQLGASNATNAQPIVVAVDASSAKKEIKLTFSEDIYKAPGVKLAAGDTLSDTYFTIAINGGAPLTGSVVAIDSKTVKFVANESFAAAGTGTVAITAAGATALKDINGQVSLTDSVSFGTR